MFKEYPFPVRAFVTTAFGAILAASLFSFVSLYGSPYTGMMLSSCGDRACIDKVDVGSPAYDAGVRKGDTFLSVNGAKFPSFLFSHDPDSIRWRKDHRVFLAWQQRFEETISKGKVLQVAVGRGADIREISIVPAQFPFSRAVARPLPIYFVSWVSAGLAFLVLRKRMNETALVNFAVWAFFCLTGVSWATYLVRDIAYPVSALRILLRSNHLGAFFCMIAVIHFVLVFPKRKKLLDAHPWMVKALYVAAAIQFILDSSGAFQDMYLTTYFPVSTAMAGVVLRLGWDLVKEKDLVHRKQVQWVISGMAATGIASLVLFNLPVMFDLPAVHEATAYPFLLIGPLCFVVAVTRYRLMDIDTIFDYALVYGATILVLEGAELAFLGAVSPYLAGRSNIPLLMTFGVLLVVFLYVPLRNAVRRTVEKLFKRGAYNTEEEIRKFIVRLGSCDNISALDKFTVHIRTLFGPSGTFIIAFKDGGAEVILSRGESSPQAAGKIAGAARDLRRYFGERRASVLGYELTDKGVLKGSEGSAGLEGAIFVPFFSGSEPEYLAVLLEKWNGTVYSGKDKVFLDAISIALTHVLEAEERRRELENERLRLAREIHDGIGSEFSGIISFCEKGERSAGSGSGDAAADILASISGSARRGMRELRNIVWALNPERQSLDYLAAYAKRYATDLLGAEGITVGMKEGTGQEEIILPPRLFLTCFRTVQEACHNVLKHAKAGSVTIELLASGGWLDLAVIDNGRGFQPLSAEGTGHGLRNLRKRAEELGGTVTFTSTSEGTAVRARLPLG